MDKDTLRARIQARIDATGKSPHAVSIAMGAGPGYVRDLLDPAKGGYPRSDKLNALASALETTTDYLMGLVSSPDPVRSEVALGDRSLGWNPPPPDPDLPPIPLVGTGDCAPLVFESDTGEVVDIERNSFDPDHTVRLIKRPPALRGAREVYAIYFQGESMMPRFEPGEVAIVDPTRPARPGDYVLVQMNDGDGEGDEVTTVLVKRLVRAGMGTVTLEQFNPACTFMVPRERIARMHRILPATDLLFG